MASVPSARNFTFSVRPSVSSSSSESAVQLEISRILAPNHSPRDVGKWIIGSQIDPNRTEKSLKQLVEKWLKHVDNKNEKY